MAAGGEHLAQQRVIAVTPALPVEHVDEAVLPVQPVQGPGAARLAGQRVGQVPRHVFGDAGPQEKHPRLGRRPAKHLVPEVVGHHGLVRGQAHYPRARARGGLGPHRGQPQAGHPAFGAPEQFVPRGPVHVEAQHGEVRVGLVGGAGQIAAAEVGELTGDPQPGQLQGRRLAGGQNQPQRGGRMPDQLVKTGQDGLVRHFVQTVEDQRDRLGEQLRHLDQAQREVLG